VPCDLCSFYCLHAHCIAGADYFLQDSIGPIVLDDCVLGNGHLSMMGIGQTANKPAHPFPIEPAVWTGLSPIQEILWEDVLLKNCGYRGRLTDKKTAKYANWYTLGSS